MLSGAVRGAAQEALLDRGAGAIRTGPCVSAKRGAPIGKRRRRCPPKPRRRRPAGRWARCWYIDSRFGSASSMALTCRRPQTVLEGRMIYDQASITYPTSARPAPRLQVSASAAWPGSATSTPPRRLRDLEPPAPLLPRWAATSSTSISSWPAPHPRPGHRVRLRLQRCGPGWRHDRVFRSEQQLARCVFRAAIHRQLGPLVFGSLVRQRAWLAACVSSTATRRSGPRRQRQRTK